MNILDGFKKLYVAGGGDSVDLENLSDNDRANMHSVIYGDGMGVKLDRNIEDTVDNIAKGGGGGTTDYERLQNKPQINGTTLEGNLTSEQLTLQEKLVAGANIIIVGNTISAVASSFDVEVVDELPTSDIKTHTIYFIEKEGTSGNVYDEYMYINDEWEHIGTTEVDLSGYVPTTRTVNGKALSSDISLTASDVGALSDTADVMVKGVDYVTAGQKAGATLGAFATAEGTQVTASGECSYAGGLLTIANGFAQHVFGVLNIEDTPNDTGQGTYVEIVGNGTQTGIRSNARTLDWDGNEVLAGKLTVGAAPTADMDVATKQYVDTTQPQVVYTTTERKIGTYLGKDLYEITYTDVTVPAYEPSVPSRHGTLLLNTLGFNDAWTITNYEGIATIGTSGVVTVLPMAYTTKYETNRTPVLDSRTGGIFKFADGWTFFNTDAAPLNVKGLTIRYVKEAL